MVKEHPDPEAVTPEPLLTAAEAAGRLHISRSFLYKLVYEGALPVIHIGSALRFRPEDLEKLRAPKTIAPRRKPRKKKGAS